MGYPTYEQWYGNLPDEVRARTDALIAELKSNGAADPEVWARSEISENIPQLARYLVLKRLWECEINPWFDDPETWIEEWSKDRHKTPIPVFADAAEAIRRVRNAGISSKDLGAIARLIAYSAAFGTVCTIDHGGTHSDSNDLPGWRLEELNPDDKPTGRSIRGLHESLLSIHEDAVRNANN